MNQPRGPQSYSYRCGGGLPRDISEADRFEQSSLTRVPLLLIPFLQGLLLFALYRAFDSNLWASESPLCPFPLWTLVIAVALLLVLAIDRHNCMCATRLVAEFCVALAENVADANLSGDRTIHRQPEPCREIPTGLECD